MIGLIIFIYNIYMTVKSGKPTAAAIATAEGRA